MLSSCPVLPTKCMPAAQKHTIIPAQQTVLKHVSAQPSTAHHMVPAQINVAMGHAVVPGIQAFIQPQHTERAVISLDTYLLCLKSAWLSQVLSASLKFSLYQM